MEARERSGKIIVRWARAFNRFPTRVSDTTIDASGPQDIVASGPALMEHLWRYSKSAA
jgi:hypothetical protein